MRTSPGREAYVCCGSARGVCLFISNPFLPTPPPLVFIYSPEHTARNRLRGAEGWPLHCPGICDDDGVFATRTAAVTKERRGPQAQKLRQQLKGLVRNSCLLLAQRGEAARFSRPLGAAAPTENCAARRTPIGLTTSSAMVRAVKRVTTEGAGHVPQRHRGA